MPTVPTSIKCSELGCSNHRSKFNSFCLQHGGSDLFGKRKGKTKERKEFNEKYQTKHWRSIRAVQLSNHPLCAGCLADGIITSAHHVDHVFPWSQLHESAFYYNLFQSLCHSCHSSKTGLERKGIFRRYGNPHRDYTIDQYERVVGLTTTEPSNLI